LVSLIDGTTLTIPLTATCSARLQRVIHEVQMSFAPAPRPELRTRATTSCIPTSPSLSPTRPSLAITPPRKRSPSSLLLSLLSPLLPVNQPQSAPQSSQPTPPPARVHRRQARSLLVDCYRRHVLPTLKEQLPESYLPWAIASESTKRLDDFAKLREEITTTLSTAGVDKSAMEYSTPLKRRRSASSCSSEDSNSDSDVTRSPVTPATSAFSSSACSTPPRPRQTYYPQSFLLTIPPAHVLPATHRNIYSAQLARLTQIASRLSVIKKLNAKYEREEGKRRWLESLELGRAGDKSLHRAFSNGHTLPSICGMTAEPIKGSRLWRTWTPEDEERAEREAEQALHPAMMPVDATEDVSSSEHESGSEALDDEEPRFRESMPYSSSTEDIITDNIIIVRPPLVHSEAAFAPEDITPPLSTSRSDESLSDSDGGWEIETPGVGDALLPALTITMNWDPTPSAPRRKSKCLDVDWVDQSEEDTSILHENADVVRVYA